MTKFIPMVLTAIIALITSSCASRPKCPTSDLTNPVFEKDSCKLKTRNVYIGDLMSPELKGKFQNPETVVQWVGTVSDGRKIVPGHFVILNSTKPGGK